MKAFDSMRAASVLSPGKCLVVALGLGFAGHAVAGCAPPIPERPGQGAPSLAGNPLLPALYVQGGLTRTGLLKVGDEPKWGWDPHPVPIVGMWKFTFTSEGSKGIPDGTTVDAGYVTWHSDGTELMNSGRAPITGSFCMGVWKALSPSTYKLNHVALAWDNTGTVLVGPARIRETVTVSHKGDSYTGTFTLDQYATDETTVLAHVQGTVTGTRVTVD